MRHPRSIMSFAGSTLLAIVLSPLPLLSQDTTSVPKPLGRLVDIGGRRLHLYCTGTGHPTVIVENGSSSF